MKLSFVLHLEYSKFISSAGGQQFIYISVWMKRKVISEWYYSERLDNWDFVFFTSLWCTFSDLLAKCNCYNPMEMDSFNLQLHKYSIIEAVHWDLAITMSHNSRLWSWTHWGCLSARYSLHQNFGMSIMRLSLPLHQLCAKTFHWMLWA